LTKREPYAGRFARLLCIDRHAWAGFSFRLARESGVETRPLKVRATMSHPFDHQALSEPLDRVIDAFKTKRVSLLQGAKLLFVCGGPTGSVPPTVRQKFLDWAATNMPNWKMFLAEKAAEDLLSNGNPPPLRLAKFEEFLGKVADCVIVFPESVGSFAETGYFSAKPKVLDNILIVNSDSEAGQSNSFLNRGPIDEIERYSHYKKIVLDFDASPPNFSLIKARLEPSPSKRRTGVSMDSFNDLRGVEQLAFLLYLFRLFPSLDLQGMKRLFQSVFGTGGWEIKRASQLLSILVSAKYVDRLAADNNYYHLVAASPPSAPSLLEIEGVSADDLRFKHLEIYSRHFRYLVPAQRTADVS
jgi:hypothetical protein